MVSPARAIAVVGVGLLLLGLTGRVALAQQPAPPAPPPAPAEGCVGRLGMESFLAPQLITQAAHVQVDRETGVVRVLRVAAGDADGSRAAIPDLLAGQLQAMTASIVFFNALGCDGFFGAFFFGLTYGLLQICTERHQLLALRLAFVALLVGLFARPFLTAAATSVRAWFQLLPLSLTICSASKPSVAGDST